MLQETQIQSSFRRSLFPKDRLKHAKRGGTPLIIKYALRSLQMVWIRKLALLICTLGRWSKTICNRKFTEQLSKETLLRCCFLDVKSYDVSRKPRISSYQGPKTVKECPLPLVVLLEMILGWANAPRSALWRPQISSSSRALINSSLQSINRVCWKC